MNIRPRLLYKILNHREKVSRAGTSRKAVARPNGRLIKYSDELRKFPSPFPHANCISPTFPLSLSPPPHLYLSFLPNTSVRNKIDRADSEAQGVELRSGIKSELSFIANKTRRLDDSWRKEIENNGKSREITPPLTISISRNGSTTERQKSTKRQKSIKRKMLKCRMFNKLAPFLLERKKGR